MGAVGGARGATLPLHIDKGTLAQKAYRTFKFFHSTLWQQHTIPVQSQEEHWGRGHYEKRKQEKRDVEEQGLSVNQRSSRRSERSMTTERGEGAGVQCEQRKQQEQQEEHANRERWKGRGSV